MDQKGIWIISDTDIESTRCLTVLPFRVVPPHSHCGVHVYVVHILPGNQ